MYLGKVMVGTYVSLQVRKILPFGAILGDEEILLPKKYMPKNCSIGESIEVFVYTDSEDRIIATTLKPYGVLEEIVALEVVDIARNGVYLDLGIAKDIFLPCKDPYVFQRGKKVVVRIEKDKEGRLLANTQFKCTPCKDRSKIFQEMKGLVRRKTPLGFECVLEEGFQGMLYHNEIFTALKIGEEVRVWVKNLRSDGKMDLKLLQEDDVEVLIKVLRENANHLKLTNDSDPQEIYKIVQMSKKAFKRAVAKLGDRIEKSKEGITLLR